MGRGPGTRGDAGSFPCGDSSTAGTNGGLLGEAIPDLGDARRDDPADNDRAEGDRDGGDADADNCCLPKLTIAAAAAAAAAAEGDTFGKKRSSGSAADCFRERKVSDSAAGPGLTGGRGRGEARRSAFQAAAAAAAIPFAASTRGIE